MGLTVAVAYIITWILLPGNDQLPENRKTKKFFRDPDKKIIGGVCSGLGAYFGADPLIFRFLFVLGIFAGGTGIFIYIAFCVMTSEAKSITDKIKMKGEPVTLSNIEYKIKENLNLKEEQELNRILLLPLRLIVALFNALGKILGPLLLFLISIVRGAAGLVLVIIFLAVLVALAAILGIETRVLPDIFWWPFPGLPLKSILNELPVIVLWAGCFLIVIPMMFIAFAGVSLLSGRKINRGFGWTMAALFFISMLVVVFMLPFYLQNFKMKSEFKQIQTMAVPSGTLVFKLNDQDSRNYQTIQLKFRVHEGPELKLVKSYSACGKNKGAALENTKHIIYKVEQKDSVIIFDKNFFLKSDVPFRFQDLELTVYIPEGKEFFVAQNMEEVHTSGLYMVGGYSVAEGNRWVFKGGTPLCLTCEPDQHVQDEEWGWENEMEENNHDDHREHITSSTVKHFAANDFNRVHIHGIFNVQIIQGAQCQVEAYGDKTSLEALSVTSDGHVLTIEMDDRFRSGRKWKKDIELKVTLPELEKLTLGGITETAVQQFKSPAMDIDIHGLSSVTMDLQVKHLDLQVKGGAKVEITGEAAHADISLSGATYLQAYDFKIKNAALNISGAGNSEVFVSQFLKINASGPSHISYKGNPEISDHTSFLSNVEKAD
jgi:phage shock protein PspC (stress-responsive transcriptional regulator)